MCQESMTLASCRVCCWAPALSSPTGPLAHRAAVAASWFCRRRRPSVTSCSPGKSCPPPRPPWGWQGVSSPSCGIGSMGDPGLVSWEALAKHFSPTGLPGLVGQDMGCTRGLRVTSRLLPVTMHCGQQPCCPHLLQGDVTKSPTVTQHLLLVSVLVDTGPTQAVKGWVSPRAQAWHSPGHLGALRVPADPTLPSCPLGTSLVPCSASQSPCSDALTSFLSEPSPCRCDGEDGNHQDEALRVLRLEIPELSQHSP